MPPAKSKAIVQPKLKRESPSYVPMGLNKEMLLRVTPELSGELRHLHKLLKRHARAFEDAESLQRSPFKNQVNDLYNEIYRGLPKPGLGEFICFCASLGMEVVRERYLGSQERSDGSKKDMIYGAFLVLCTAAGMDVARGKHLPASQDKGGDSKTSTG